MAFEVMMRRQSKLFRAVLCVLLLQHQAFSFVAPSQRLSPANGANNINNNAISPATSCRGSSTARYGMWDQDGDLEGPDKLKACVPYILPILDGDHFGQFIYDRIPPLSFVHDILLGGLLHLWDIFPFSGLVLFIALTLGTRGNTEMDRNVRFSAQQAGLIDVSLVVPELIAGSFEGADVPRALLEPCSNFTYYYIVFVVAYCVANNLRGKKPDQIPYISGWSDMMVGPF